MSLEILLKGDMYYGNVKGMIPHGKGKYTWSDGTVYEDSWKKGKIITNLYNLSLIKTI